MRAVVYEQYGPPEVLEIREIPTPRPRRNELLVRVHATTVSSGDWRARSLIMPKGFGPFGRLVFGVARPRQPILGTELSGVVESTGGGVTRFKKGDAVFAFTGAAMGAHAEYRLVAADGLVALKPTNLTHDEAATLCFGGLTVLGFFRRANLVAGERILINGASGAIGIAATQLAKHFGAHVTTVSSGANRGLLTSLGADEALDYTREDFTANGKRYDVIVDAAGTAPFARIKTSLTERGRFVPILGSPSDWLRAPWISATSRQRIISGMVRSRASDLLLLRNLAQHGIYRPVIDRRYGLDQIIDAHRYVDTGRKKGSVVVTLLRGSGDGV